MQFSKDAVRRIQETVRKKEDGPKGTGSQSRGPRYLAPPRNAVVTVAFTPRVGLQKGFGTVNILADDGTGTGKDRIIQTGVKVWNPYTGSSQPGVGRYVTIEIKDGVLQLVSASCPS